MATLIDSNVLLDLLTGDPAWADWSEHAMRAASLRGPLLINDIIYAEISRGFARVEALDAAIAALQLDHAAMPRPALFLAARAFTAYGRRGGTRTGVMADFFVGAHAAVAAIPLITRDPMRYRQEFPTISLVTP